MVVTQTQEAWFPFAKIFKMGDAQGVTHVSICTKWESKSKRLRLRLLRRAVISFSADVSGQIVSIFTMQVKDWIRMTALITNLLLVIEVVIFHQNLVIKVVIFNHVEISSEVDVCGEICASSLMMLRSIDFEFLLGLLDQFNFIYRITNRSSLRKRMMIGRSRRSKWLEDRNSLII